MGPDVGDIQPVQPVLFLLFHPLAHPPACPPAQPPTHPPTQVIEWYTPDPVRFSDHDPIIVDMKLTAPAVGPLSAPTLNNASVITGKRKANGASASSKGWTISAVITDNSNAEKFWRLLLFNADFAIVHVNAKVKSSTGPLVGGTSSLSVYVAPGKKLASGAYSVVVYACDKGTASANCGPASNVLRVTVP